MSRLLDHWKLPQPLEKSYRPWQGGSLPPDAVPQLSRFCGRTIWIHPSDTADPGSPFTTDDEKTPFRPDVSIESVQLERYTGAVAAEGAKTRLLKTAYYLLKPLMPRSAQLAAQRMNANSRMRKSVYPAWPGDDSVDHLLQAALGCLLDAAGLERTPFIGFWPKGYRWAACFTHDVEMTAGLRAMDRMAGIEEEYGIRSTWYIVPERYPVKSSDFASLRDRGHEIGVHGLNHDGKLFASEAEFMRRVPLINRYIREWEAVGFRSPALYRNADWITRLEIRYDTSYMDTAILEPQYGGVGMVLPYYLDDRVLELPITMPMDHHLINLLRKDTVQGMSEKFRWVVERGGLANFLFHPDYNLEQERMDDYRKVVDEVTGTEGGWVATAAEIADWWDRRHRSHLREETGTIRVDGPAADDAEVWTAVRDGTGLRIERGQ